VDGRTDGEGRLALPCLTASATSRDGEADVLPFRSIGVSNFGIDDLGVLLASAKIRPAANQVRTFWAGRGRRAGGRGGRKPSWRRSTLLTHRHRCRSSYTPTCTHVRRRFWRTPRPRASFPRRTLL
jgi:hypothetical protein